MSLVRLIYASRFSKGIGPNDIQDILSISRKNNEEKGITGVLCYDPDFFLQCLEGERAEVNTLYGHIVRDQRHKDVDLLEYSDIEEPLFKNWSMAYVRIDELTEPILAKYGTNSKFDPYELSAHQVLSFIKEIAEERQAYLEQQKEKLT
jgi:hypothetical protein